ncbi:hypothetical protein, partial [Parabacteroides distasonis]|uniref:hypothetical protein n=1 Tax=Parabacteroides distasonis TaxID=823 RepID=UPI001E50661C
MNKAYCSCFATPLFQTNFLCVPMTMVFSYQKERGCVKMLAQPFFMRKARTFPSPGFVITQSLCNFRHKVFRYGKVTF